MLVRHKSEGSKVGKLVGFLGARGYGPSIHPASPSQPAGLGTAFIHQRRESRKKRRRTDSSTMTTRFALEDVAA
jgi:hypothetical protein